MFTCIADPKHILLNVQVYELSELERGHFTDKDQEIRITDLPEQFLQRTYPVVPREAAELEREAKWIYQQAFVTRTISKQVSLLVPIVYTYTQSSVARPYFCAGAI